MAAPWAGDSHMVHSKHGPSILTNSSRVQCDVYQAVGLVASELIGSRPLIAGFAFDSEAGAVSI